MIELNWCCNNSSRIVYDMVGSTTAPAEFLNEARCVSLHDEVTTRTHPTLMLHDEVTPEPTIR